MNYSVLFCSFVVYISVFNIKLVSSGPSSSNGSEVTTFGGVSAGHETETDPNGSIQSNQSTEIKIFVKDPNDGSKTIEFYNTIYTSREEKGETFYDYRETVEYMSISFGEQQVWNYDSNKFNGKHPTSISYVPNKKLFVYFDEQFIAYERRVDGVWKESPTLKYNLTSASGHSSVPKMKELSVSDYPKNIKLLTTCVSDSRKTVELAAEKFTVKQYENNTDLFLYQFKSDVECTRVECDNKEVWRYDSSKHNGKYPISLSYNKNDSRVLLDFRDFYVTYKKGSDGNWKGTQSSVSDVTKSILGYFGISYKNDFSGPSLSSIKLGAASTASSDVTNSLLQSYGIKDIELTASEPTDIEFFTVDPSDSTKVKQLDSSNYNKVEGLGDYTYKFKDGVNCTLVKCGNKDVWKKGDKDINEPKSVSYYKSENKCVVRDIKKAVFYKLDNGSWKYFNSYNLSTGTSTQTGSGAKSFRIFLKQLNLSEYPKRVKLFTLDPGNPNNNLELTTNFYKVEKYERLKEDFYYSFTDGAKCTLVKIEDEVVWKKGDNDMSEPKSITYNERSDILRLLDTTKRVTYTKNGAGKWVYYMTEALNYTETSANNSQLIQSTTMPVPSLLMLTYPSGTSVDGAVETGTPTSKMNIHASVLKDPKFFTSDGSNNLLELDSDKYTVEQNTERKNEFFYKFNDGVKCTLIKCDDKDVWSKDNTFEPKFVRFYKEHGLIIILDDNSSIFYILTNNDWKLIANGSYVDDELVGVDSSNVPAEIKFYALDPNDSDTTLELDCSHFDVKTYLGKNDEYFYEFKSDSKCTLIKCNNDSVWRQDTSDDTKYPLSMNYNQKDHKIVLHFDKSVLVYKKDSNNNWNLKKLDINFFGPDPKDSSKTVGLLTSTYDLSEEGDDYLFKFKKDVKCSMVNIKGEELWKHNSNNGDKYPLLARYKKNGTKFVLEFEGSKLTFEKDSKGKWKSA